MRFDELFEGAFVLRGLSLARLIDAVGQHGTANEHRQKKQLSGSKCARQRWLPAAPAPDTFGTSDRSGENGFAVEKTIELLAQHLRGRITFVGIFLDALKADRFQVTRNAGIEQARCDWIFVE